MDLRHDVVSSKTSMRSVCIYIYIYTHTHVHTSVHVHVVWTVDFHI